jgi:hypothetical protein
MSVVTSHGREISSFNYCVLTNYYFNNVRRFI